MKKTIHFIGIGGISMSAIATYCQSIGHNVQGSDIVLNENIIELKKKKIPIFLNHNPNNLTNVDICVFSSSIKDDNPELNYALKNNIKTIERSKFLALISKNFKNIIAISGTHGKTTTTAMISKVFNEAKLFPTVHIGGNYDQIGGNFLKGNHNYFITEACEYKESFLELTPNYSIITNVELDHVDYYQSLNQLNESFYKFAQKTKNLCFVNGDNQFFNNTTTLPNIISFGKGKHNDYQLKDYKFNSKSSFKIYYKGKYLQKITLPLLGEYNAMNALSCFAICHSIGIDSKNIAKSLKTFKNVNRRLQLIRKNKNFVIYKDYAHHPTEIYNVLNSLSLLKNYGKITCFFQPHTYSRTKGLFNEFLDCFNNCDELYLLPTYPARELEIKGGKSEDLFLALKTKKKKVYFLNDTKICKDIVNKNTEKTIFVFLGAGDIENIADELKKA